MKKSAIVTGATSFIGISLIKWLVEHDYRVTAIIRPNSERKILLQRLYPTLELVECQLRELEHLILPQEQYELMFHIGWNSDFINSRFNLAGQMENVRYCEYAVELAARYHCKAYLSVGSQAECGVVSKPINSMTMDNPMTAYAEAKCIAYDKTKQLCHQYGIKQYWPRLLSAYGPFDRNTTMIMSCINACKEKKILELTPAEQIWDFVYVGDVAKALLAIIEWGVPEKKYAIASGTGKPLKDYITQVAEIMEFPQLLGGIGKKAYAENQVMYLVGDMSELYQDTGIRLEYDFRQGIRDILLV